MPRRHASISLRLTLWFGLVLLAGWFLFGAAMWFNLQHTLNSERRQTLDRRLDRLQDLLRRDQQLSDGDRYSDFHDFAAATGNGLIEIFLPSGQRLWPTPSSAAGSFPWPSVDTSGRERFTQAVVHGQSYWVIVRPFHVFAQPVLLMAAAPESGNRLVLDRFRSGLVASAPILLFIAMASGYWLSRRALSPVDRITASLHSIGIRNLSERLPPAPADDELQRLTLTCNQMLERLEGAVRTLRQFTADASHELRGPLALTRTVAEVALRRHEMEAASRAAFQEIADESARATALLEEMLDLARADTEPLDIPFEPIDLSTIAADVCSVAQTLARDRGIDVRFHSSDSTSLTVLGHAPSVRRLLWILLDNAIKYSSSPGRVELYLTGLDKSVIVEVSDTGIGIPADELPRIFDRFYRVDPSRSNVEGSGLGLSIAQWIVESHHAEIKVISQPGSGSLFTLTFPR